MRQPIRGKRYFEKVALVALILISFSHTWFPLIFPSSQRDTWLLPPFPYRVSLTGLPLHGLDYQLLTKSNPSPSPRAASQLSQITLWTIKIVFTTMPPFFYIVDLQWMVDIGGTGIRTARSCCKRMQLCSWGRGCRCWCRRVTVIGSRFNLIGFYWGLSQLISIKWSSVMQFPSPVNTSQWKRMSGECVCLCVCMWVKRENGIVSLLIFWSNQIDSWCRSVETIARGKHTSGFVRVCGGEREVRGRGRAEQSV